MKVIPNCQEEAKLKLKIIEKGCNNLHRLQITKVSNSWRYDTRQTLTRQSPDYQKFKIK